MCFDAKILHRTNNIHNLYTMKLCFIFKYPSFLCLWCVRKLSQVYSVHPLKNYAHAYLSIVPLLFEVFWALRPSGYHLFEMHVVQLACFRGHLSQHRHKHKSRERHGGSARWSFTIYTFTNDVIKKNRSSLHSPKVLRPPALIQGREGHKCILRPFSLLFIFFFWWKREQERRSVQAQRWMECIFQSGAELCAKSPQGPPLLKAISSQNECGSNIGLALISIHLACLCARDGWGHSWRVRWDWGRAGGRWVALIVCVLCLCVDDARDKVKHLIDGGTVSRGTTCGGSLTDFLFPSQAWII